MVILNIKNGPTNAKNLEKLRKRRGLRNGTVRRARKTIHTEHHGNQSLNVSLFLFKLFSNRDIAK